MEPSQVEAMGFEAVIESLFENVVRCTSNLSQTSCGECECLSEETTDAYNVPLSGRSIEWTYYTAGPVDEITITNKDDGGNPTGGYVVKHYTDGKQPTMTTF
jgi:hypothetical protein